MTAEQPAANSELILDIRELCVRFHTKRGVADAIDHVSLPIPLRSSVGLVGESGCGKSTLMKATIQVLAENAKITSGSVIYDGIDLVTASSETVRRKRWAGISMITQSALNALNPVKKVGDQIVEAIRAHRKMSYRDAWSKAEEMLDLVGVDSKRAGEFPHQFSGGMRQRAIIAMSLVLQPDLVLADEPTTSLDVIVQDQIFRKIRSLQEQLGFSLLLVTHDLGVVIENCDRIVVMYAGQVVEEGPVESVVNTPFHPYTLGLKNSLPRIDAIKEPIAIPGTPPDPIDMPVGCRFAPRCPFAQEACRQTKPQLVAVGDGHRAACIRHEEIPSLRDEAEKLETWANTKKPVFQVQGDHLMKHYFAYGTLLGEEAMQAFAPSARAVGVMRLDGYELAFGETHKSGKGGCWLKPVKGSCVYGVQYKLSDEDMDRMDKASGIPDGLWVHKPVTLVDEHGNELKSNTYTIPGSPSEFQPDDDYLGKIQAGLDTIALPADYIAKVARNLHRTT